MMSAADLFEMSTRGALPLALCALVINSARLAFREWLGIRSIQYQDLKPQAPVAMSEG
jgi:hypothetical protein